MLETVCGNENLLVKTQWHQVVHEVLDKLQPRQALESSSQSGMKKTSRWCCKSGHAVYKKTLLWLCSIWAIIRKGWYLRWLQRQQCGNEMRPSRSLQVVLAIVPPHWGFSAGPDLGGSCQKWLLIFCLHMGFDAFPLSNFVGHEAAIGNCTITALSLPNCVQLVHWRSGRSGSKFLPKRVRLFILLHIRVITKTLIVHELISRRPLTVLWLQNLKYPMGTITIEKLWLHPSLGWNWRSIIEQLMQHAEKQQKRDLNQF